MWFFIFELRKWILQRYTFISYIPRSGTTTKGVEKEESLESSTLVSQFPDAIQNKIHDLLADRVVTTSIVVSGILLSSDELLGVEQLTICTSTHLIYNIRIIFLKMSKQFTLWMEFDHFCI